jgi:hypothetical protein
VVQGAGRTRKERHAILPAMKAFRLRLILAVIAVLVGVYAMLRGKRSVRPTSDDGWRDLDGPEFR